MTWEVEGEVGVILSLCLFNQCYFIKFYFSDIFIFYFEFQLRHKLVFKFQIKLKNYFL